MRWLMVSQDTPREALGGTELYVRRLSEALLANGDDVSWVYFAEGETGTQKVGLQSDGIEYYKISGRSESRTREQAWRIDPTGVNEFRQVLNLAHPASVLFNGFGPNQSPEHFAAAKQAGATVLMTYHSPGQSCARWDLLYKGQEMCSGLIDVKRCTDCALHRIGVPGMLRSVLAGRDLSQLARVLPHNAQHPFMRRKGLMDFQRRWQEGVAQLDKVLWHADWVKDLLRLNGVEEDRLHYLPLPPPSGYSPKQTNEQSDFEVRRFIFIGRLTDIKGPHIITQAVQHIPHDEKIEVLIVGAKGPQEYQQRIEMECRKDVRLRLLAPVAFDQIPALMADVDAVIVPSLWPETGPYTVLEALWTGTPVVGSDRAGIHELLGKFGGGVLFEAGNAKHLAELLVKCDFHSMRRDPASFQTAWRSLFARQLSALSNAILV